MKQKTLNYIDKKHKETGGNNGTSIVELKIYLKCDLMELKKCLNELHKEEKIIVKKGANNKLVFKNG